MRRSTRPPARFRRRFLALRWSLARPATLAYNFPMVQRKRPTSASRAHASSSSARLERSAGVVVFRDVPGPGAPRRLFLLLDYGKHWDYPKGHVEPQEDDRTAALRELREETGITAELVPGFSQEIVYFFRSGSKGLVRKQVIFFAARAHDQEVRLSEEHVGYAWLDRDSALKRLTFDNARKVLAATADFLEQHAPLQK
jgi:8-oxo-dGTP pyrophosphatase MutT (NUDIX family)